MRLSRILAVALFVVIPASLFAQEAKDRSEIPDEYKWDLTSMYTSAEEWEAELEEFKERLPEVEQYKGHLGDSGEALLAAIKKQEELSMMAGNLYVYAGLKSFEDLRNSENAGRFSQARTVLSELSEASAYFTPELLSIPETKLDTMVENTEGLHIYRHYLDEELRLRPYTLSESEEKLLAMASDPLAKFNNVFSAIDNADITFGKVENEDGKMVELTKGLYGSFLYSDDRRVRKDAWIGLFTEYEKLGNTLAANYEGHVKSRIFFADARGYDSALQAAVYPNAIPVEVYTSLLEAVRSGAPAMQRYLEIRRNQLELDTLEVWDMYAPMFESSFKNVDWEEAKTIVADALSILGDDYIELYWRGFEDGWVDPFENRGKRGGAYSWGTYTSKPYLSMNYIGTLSDVSTLAHEYGHSLHSWMSHQTQPYVYGSYRTFIAEIASMTNEAILHQKMLAEAETKEIKLEILQQYLDQFRGALFRQASFADFELKAHELAEAGQPLTKESLNELYTEVFKDYYGDAVHMNPLLASEWSRIPHFLRTDNFYVYQYATSFAAATALAKRILEGGDEERQRFMEMLRAGSNDYPIELLKKAGVDMTTPQPIYDTITVFESLVDELEETLAES
jgi:oligoendopeptidase F